MAFAVVVHLLKRFAAFLNSSDQAPAGELDRYMHSNHIILSNATARCFP